MVDTRPAPPGAGDDTASGFTPPRLRRRSLPARAGAGLRRHVVFVVAFIIGAALRVVVGLAYPPALELNGDSYAYLLGAYPLQPGTWHPEGYPLLLRILAHFGKSLEAVTITQHVMTLAAAIALYVLLQHLGVRRWLSAVGTMPLLFDSYQLDLEQFIMAETMVSVLLVISLVLLLRRRRPGTLAAAAGGVVIAFADLTRLAFVPVLAVFAVYFLVRRAWRPLVAMVIPAVAIIIAYGAWYNHTNGHFGYSDYAGVELYGRVAPIATCHYKLTPEERRLCPKTPVSARTHDADFWTWEPGTPLNQPGLGTTWQRSQLADKWAKQVIIHQPLAYLQVVAADTIHYFEPGRWMAANKVEMIRWQFPRANIQPNVNYLHINFADAGFGLKHLNSHPRVALIGPLRTYQSHVYTPGWLLLLCLIGSLVTAAGMIGRRRHIYLRQARWAGLVMAVCGFAFAFVPSLTAAFSYRYSLPMLVVLPPAGVIAAEVGLEWLKRRSGRAPLAHATRTSPAVPAAERASG